MIGLDTNVLIRYIVQDDEAQLARATALLEQGLSIESPGFISTVVMAEFAWTLKRPYGLSDDTIAAVIERLLEIETLAIDHRQVVYEAMTELRDGRASFTDALIAGLARAAGREHAVTFDRKASRLEGFRLLA